MTQKQQVRVRIAPSPTGFLHVGTARTALFNWLFAKKQGGVFILRIEDTDRERSKKEYEKDILESLQWLGIVWDEGPYRQSERRDIYLKYAKKLIETRHAYYCFCTKEELEAERQGMLSQGIAPKYSGRCRNLTPEEIAKNHASSKSSVIRFRMPEETITFHDLIRGAVSFDMALVGDFVIAKGEDEPLYNFAAVIDDFAMKISHVIRGEDHIANTPKQIAIARAFGFPEPHFGHLPLILDTDRSKMSKRHSATAIAEYQKAGYLPEAMVNFLALLGWHPAPEHDEKTGKTVEHEIFTLAELTGHFDISRIQKAGAVFNIQKLDWLNAQYLKKLSDDEFLEQARTHINVPADILEERLIDIVHLVRDRMKKLSDFNEYAEFFFRAPDYKPELLIWKKTSKEMTLENLEKARGVIAGVHPREFNAQLLMEALNPLSISQGRGEVFWPLRAAISGREASPGPFEMMEVLGKGETLSRIAGALEKLAKLP